MERNDGDLEARDLNNGKFWHALHETFSDTIQMIREDAKERGIGLDDPELVEAAAKTAKAERRQAAKNRPLSRAALAYLKAADKWFAAAQPAFRAKGVELETLVRLEIGSPRTEAAELTEFVEVIRGISISFT